MRTSLSPVSSTVLPTPPAPFSPPRQFAGMLPVCIPAKEERDAAAAAHAPGKRSLTQWRRRRPSAKDDAGAADAAPSTSDESKHGGGSGGSIRSNGMAHGTEWGPAVGAGAPAGVGAWAYSPGKRSFDAVAAAAAACEGGLLPPTIRGASAVVRRSCRRPEWVSRDQSGSPAASVELTNREAAEADVQRALEESPISHSSAPRMATRPNPQIHLRSRRRRCRCLLNLAAPSASSSALHQGSGFNGGRAALPRATAAPFHRVPPREPQLHDLQSYISLPKSRPNALVRSICGRRPSSWARLIYSEVVLAVSAVEPARRSLAPLARRCA